MSSDQSGVKAVKNLVAGMLTLLIVCLIVGAIFSPVVGKIVFSVVAGFGVVAGLSFLFIAIRDLLETWEIFE